ncbi:ATP-binding protein [Halalkalibacter alkalisediminis]|uniref:histidine kinase n=1 Tax=Halalkalibacter alkalisediminis TaxID=935616 RepID=A0ABV6NGE0_9BACI|nr:sensor histidine kinase [Halalkalibacter alkalisediminis]
MENLYMNVLIILTSIFVYHIFVNVHQLFKRNNKLLLIILSVASIALCMKFPIYEHHGHVFDLRFIPILIGAVYGGRNVVLTLSLFSVVNRFFIGGDGFYVHFITIVIMFVLLYTWYIPKLNSLSLKKKIYYSIFLSLSYLLLEFLTCHLMFGTMTKIHPSLIFTSFVTKLLLTAGLIYLVEYLKKANEVMENYYIQDKFKGLSEMASSISHEVRNPLTVTKGFIQLVMKDENLNKEKRDQHLGLALQELNRAESIITDYLTYAKPYEEINLEPIDVVEEITYTINVINPLALMHNVKCRILHDESNVYFISIDRKKFQQLIINLAKNAIEAMPGGGELDVTISAEGKYVTIQLADSGVGMTEEELSRLGTPFFSLKEKGTGLGTMVVFRLVDALNGQISVESTKGIGTEFKVAFKRVEALS